MYKTILYIAKSKVTHYYFVKLQMYILLSYIYHNIRQYDYLHWPVFLPLLDFFASPDSNPSSTWRLVEIGLDLGRLLCVGVVTVSLGVSMSEKISELLELQELCRAEPSLLESEMYPGSNSILLGPMGQLKSIGYHSPFSDTFMPPSPSGASLKLLSRMSAKENGKNISNTQPYNQELVFELRLWKFGYIS